MAQEVKSNIIDVMLYPNVDDQSISYNQLLNVIGSSNIENQFEQQYTKFKKYLSSFSSIEFVDKYYKLMELNLDKNSYKTTLTFSYKGLLQYLSDMLNCSSDIKITPDDLYKKLKELVSISNEKQLKQNFPQLYKKIYMPNRFYSLGNDQTAFINLFESTKNNFLLFNRLKELYKKRNIDIQSEYIYAKSCVDVNTFVSCVIRHFKSILDNLEKIKDWINNNPIQMELKDDDKRKLYLYLMYQEIENMKRYISANERISAQKSAINIEQLIEEYQKLYPNDDTNIHLDKDLTDTDLILDFSRIQKLYEEQLSICPYLNKDILMPGIDLNLSVDKNMDIANKYISSFFEEINPEDNIIDVSNSNNEIIRKIERLDENKKKLSYKKLKMILVDVTKKPKIIQKGSAPFIGGWYAYFYENGLVVLDRVAEYSALYIMPVHMYFKLRGDAVTKKINLTEIRDYPEVEYIEHKKRDDSWLKKAQSFISNGVNGLTLEDANRVNNNKVIMSVDFPGAEILEEIIKLLKSEEEKKSKVRQKKANDIDEKLKTSNPEPDLRDSEKRAILEEEKTLDDKFGAEASFEELYESLDQDKKTKRNPAVSKYCKDRTIDEEGLYHCEMCNKKYNSYEKSRIDFHHFVPISEGGPDTIYNGICLCTECHRIIHYEKERITSKVKLQILSIIENHIKKENPEYLEHFFDYVRKFFPTINDLLYEKQKDLRDKYKKAGVSPRKLEEKLNDAIRNYEKKLMSDYEENPDKYDVGFEIDWANEGELGIKSN